jgi:hypothetical protein
MTTQSVPPAARRNIDFISHSDQGGRPDGIQIMVHRGYAYIGHMFSNGVSVLDVRDPRHPRPVAYVPAPPGTWNIHLQTHEDLLLVINEVNFYAVESLADEKAYYTRSVGESSTSGDPFGRRQVDYAAGLRVFDISRPEEPREIGFMPVEGPGLHRIWYGGGRYAFVSAFLDGYTDHIFMVVDMSNPRSPREVSRWWLPGMWKAGEESPTWGPGRRVALHHAVVAGDIAYGSWRDGGLTLLDVSSPEKPRLIAHRNWCPPFGGGTHSALPLTHRVPEPKQLVIVADEAVLDDCADQVKYTWVVDIREKSNPVTISTFPTPSERDYCKAGGHFGPHNLHENRPGSFQSSELIFATYQNAGVRVFDIRNPFRPEEVGYYVPGDVRTFVDTRPNRPRVVHSADVFVDANGIMYVTDINAGLHILEFKGM